MELDVSILRKLLEYIFENKENLTTKSYLKLLTNSDISKLSNEDKKRIFEIVYSYFQDIGHWMDYDIAEKLSFYYDESLYSYIETYFKREDLTEERGNVVTANSCIMIGYLLERGYLNTAQRNQWENRLNNLIKNNKNGVVLRKALFALGNFKDINLFTENIIDTAFNFDEHAVTSLIYALQGIDPNSPVAYNVFLRAIEKKKPFSARSALEKVKKKESLGKILKQISDNENLLRRFIENNIYEKNDDIFIDNIKNVLDKDIVERLKIIVSESFSIDYGYYARESVFVEKLILLINHYSKSEYIFELLESCDDGRRIFDYDNIFSATLKKEDVKKFIILCNKKSSSNRCIAFSILKQIRDSKRSDAQSIYEEGKKYLKNEYKTEESRISQISNDKNDTKLETYNSFKFKLEPEKDKYSTDIFRFYIQNKDEIEAYITHEDKKRLEEIITKYILDSFDPRDQKLTIKNNGGGNTITSHPYIFALGYCLKAAKLLRLNLKIPKYRQKILNYIPYASDSDYKDVVFSIIDDPTEQELNNVLEILKNRDDDLVQYTPSSIIDVIEEYKLIKGIDLLKNEFIDSENVDLYHKERALEVIANVSRSPNEKQYFQSVFNKKHKTKSEETNRDLSEKANEILINKFKDDDAIKWRFEEIINRAFPLQEQKNSGFVSKNRQEIYDKKFAKPLSGLKDPKYKTQFLELFDASFSISRKGSDYWEYVQYLWSVVIDYFRNLKELRDYSILDDLENSIKKKYLAKEKNINWFSYRYEELKLEYIQYIGKPQNISDCIKKYNDFKEKVYLPVSTPRDLFELIKRVFDNDLRNWIEQEGAYKFISEYKKVKNKNNSHEDLMQKTIKSQFENCLLRAGLRAN